MTERVATLEASGRAALPALHEERLGDWLLRVSGGETKRVNSVNPVVPGAEPGEVMAAAQALFAAHAQPCRFRLTPLADASADAALAAAGFTVVDRSWTMVVSLQSLPVDACVIISPRADRDWLDRVERLSGRSPAAAAVQSRLLAGIPGPLGLAAIDEGDGVVAAGYASIGEGSIGERRAQLSDIVVAPHMRGRGLGRRLVAGLLGWAQAQGCREAMLQVKADNGVARRLYRSLGFVDIYPYHYRVR